MTGDFGFSRPMITKLNTKSNISVDNPINEFISNRIPETNLPGIASVLPTADTPNTSSSTRLSEKTPNSDFRYNYGVTALEILRRNPWSHTKQPLIKTRPSAVQSSVIDLTLGGQERFKKPLPKSDVNKIKNIHSDNHSTNDLQSPLKKSKTTL